MRPLLSLTGVSLEMYICQFIVDICGRFLIDLGHSGLRQLRKSPKIPLNMIIFCEISNKNPI
jgi:hypothetical protein